MKIAVVGTGYVGLVTGAGFSHFGQDVGRVDIDTDRLGERMLSHFGKLDGRVIARSPRERRAAGFNYNGVGRPSADQVAASTR